MSSCSFHLPSESNQQVENKISICNETISINATLENQNKLGIKLNLDNCNTLPVAITVSISGNEFPEERVILTEDPITLFYTMPENLNSSDISMIFDHFKVTGIKNSGDDGFIDSAIQIIYNIPYYRNSYIESDECKNLIKVFGLLEKSTKPVSIFNLGCKNVVDQFFKQAITVHALEEQEFLFPNFVLFDQRNSHQIYRNNITIDNTKYKLLAAICYENLHYFSIIRLTKGNSWTVFSGSDISTLSSNVTISELYSASFLLYSSTIDDAYPEVLEIPKYSLAYANYYIQSRTFDEKEDVKFEIYDRDFLAAITNFEFKGGSTLVMRRSQTGNDLIAKICELFEGQTPWIFNDRDRFIPIDGDTKCDDLPSRIICRCDIYSGDYIFLHYSFMRSSGFTFVGFEDSYPEEDAWIPYNGRIVPIDPELYSPFYITIGEIATKDFPMHYDDVHYFWEELPEEMPNDPSMYYHCLKVSGVFTFDYKDEIRFPLSNTTSQLIKCLMKIRGLDPMKKSLFLWPSDSIYPEVHQTPTSDCYDTFEYDLMSPSALQDSYRFNVMTRKRITAKNKTKAVIVPNNAKVEAIANFICQSCDRRVYTWTSPCDCRIVPQCTSVGQLSLNVAVEIDQNESVPCAVLVPAVVKIRDTVMDPFFVEVRNEEVKQDVVEKLTKMVQDEDPELAVKSVEFMTKTKFDAPLAIKENEQIAKIFGEFQYISVVVRKI